MKPKKGESIYQLLGEKVQAELRQKSQAEKIELGVTVRRLRQEKKITGVELCKRAGGLDPRTLTAVEKGRIQNPSIKTLQAISKGLGITVSDIFRQAETGGQRHFYLGSQKGAYQIDFPWWGLKMVSFTPLLKDFFCGKILLGPKKRLDQTLLKHSMPIFVAVLVGRFEVTVEWHRFELKEGENLFFNGILRHSFYNPLHRESVLLLMTAPSFL